MFYLESRIIVGLTRGVKGDVSHGASLADNEDLDGLRHLATSEDGGVDELPALE